MWYRYGSWMMLYGSGGHLVGFSTSRWLSRHDSDTTDTMGLWSRCHDEQCSHLSPNEVPGWLVAVRVLECVGVVLIAMWLLKYLCMKVQTDEPPFKWWTRLTRLEEILAIFLGCITLPAVGVFGVASANDTELKDFSLSWSFWLVVGGASISTLGGFVIAIKRIPAFSAPKPNTRTIGPTGRGRQLEGGANNTRSAQHAVGEAPRRHGDVTNIFNVSAEADYQRGRNSPYCWTDVGHSPPVYSLAVAPGHTVHSGGERNPHPSTQVLDFSFSPPPPYEAVVNELPPPYQALPSAPNLP
ncbi:hypothetical protein V1264_011324 [Littorina saxatilis]